MRFNKTYSNSVPRLFPPSAISLITLLYFYIHIQCWNILPNRQKNPERDGVSLSVYNLYKYDCDNDIDNIFTKRFISMRLFTLVRPFSRIRFTDHSLDMFFPNWVNLNIFEYILKFYEISIVNLILCLYL